MAWFRKYEFGENISGLDYVSNVDGDMYMYAIKNNPSTIYKLYNNSNIWSKVDTKNWEDGMTLYYPDGDGNPDTEDFTFTDNPNEFYACVERNGNGESNLSILRYDLTETETETINMNQNLNQSIPAMIATHEWDVNEVFPSVGANLGFEGITYVPDSYLTKYGLEDINTNTTYNPTKYSNHGYGLFFVGLEENGVIYGLALNHEDTSEYHIITSFASGEESVMAVYFDIDVGYLWTICDDSCDGKHHVFTLTLNSNSKSKSNAEGGSSSSGTFEKIASYDRPTGMKNYNNEGYMVSPEASCCDDNSYKVVYWADDGDDKGHVIRSGTVPCGDYISL